MFSRESPSLTNRVTKNGIDIQCLFSLTITKKIQECNLEAATKAELSSSLLVNAKEDLSLACWESQVPHARYPQLNHEDELPR
jgi:hypothetical protein